MSGLIRIGSRGSLLALWQAEHVAGLLRSRGHEVAIEVIRTTGDRMQAVTFAEVGATVPKGMFTLEIEEALAAGRVDLAVHSLKDLPTELPEQFVLGATPARVDARDVLVSRDYAGLADLPTGARIGTSSLRRQAQLRYLRPDLEFLEFRGNVDTRLRKLGEGQADAIVLAAAGLDRLEKTDWVRERLVPEVMCPAAGQGALGIEIRAGDERMAELVGFLDDAATRFAVTAERTALAALGGGCQVPIGVYCWPLPQALPKSAPASETENGSGFAASTLPAGSAAYSILGVVADPDGSQLIRGSARSEAAGSSAESLGLTVAALLKSKGASELLEGIGIH